jgi:hypothetical protein
MVKTDDSRNHDSHVRRPATCSIITHERACGSWSSVTNLLTAERYARGMTGGDALVGFGLED